jgi:hypothetical protein
MVGFLIAVFIVGGVRAFAFRGTNSGAFVIDIILLVILTAAINHYFF